MSGTSAVLGIDLGTSQLKALVAASSGGILGRGRASYPVTVPAPGQAESDPEDWWRAARGAVRAALAEAGGPGIEAIAVAGQMHGGGCSPTYSACRSTRPARRG